jgi:8-oxo-dGTP pyrophosphatase MutT (NUDIX family)
MPGRRPNEISAGGVLARPSERGWEVCLVRARRHWGLPKGHLEAGESPQQAALREIAEECGVNTAALSIVAELPASEYVYRRDGRLMFKLVHHFLVVAPAGSQVAPQPGEIDEAEWLPIGEAMARASFEDTRTALTAARALLEADSIAST